MSLGLVWVVLAAGLGTYLMRTLPLVHEGDGWPLWLRRGLDHVTPAVLGALLLPGVLVTGGHLPTRPWLDPALLALVPTAMVAFATRHLFLTVGSGVALFAILQSVVR